MPFTYYPRVDICIWTSQSSLAQAATVNRCENPFFFSGIFYGGLFTVCQSFSGLRRPTGRHQLSLPPDVVYNLKRGEKKKTGFTDLTAKPQSQLMQRLNIHRDRPLIFTFAGFSSLEKTYPLGSTVITDGSLKASVLAPLGPSGPLPRRI